jgi:putative transposase
LYPTVRQRGLLTAMLADHATLYNAALQERRDGWKARSRRDRDPKDTYGRVRFGTQSGQLPAIRTADPDQARWSARSQQNTLRRLDKAFAAFFRRVKAGQAPGYPRFKGRGYFDTVTFTHGDGCRWDAGNNTNPAKKRVYLQGAGHVRTQAHREVAGTVKEVSVKREGNHWYLVLACDDVPAQSLPATGAVVGLDMATGDNGLAWASDGDRLDNPRHLHRAADRLAAAQRDLATKKRGSNRRKKAVARVGSIHRKVRRARLDHHHKTGSPT